MKFALSLLATCLTLTSVANAQSYYAFAPYYTAPGTVPLWDTSTQRLLTSGVELTTGGHYTADAGKVVAYGAYGDLIASTSLDVYGTSPLTEVYAKYGNGYIFFSNPLYGGSIVIYPPATAASQAIHLPDATGTVALKEDLPVRMWVNFDGSTTANQAATYGRSGTTVTITLTNHGYQAGHIVKADFTTGGALDGIYTITGVIDANNFTVTTAASGSIGSGSAMSLLRDAILGSQDVVDVVHCGTGDHVVNFKYPLTSAGYAYTIDGGLLNTTVTGGNVFWGSKYDKTTHYLRIVTGIMGGSPLARTPWTFSDVSVTVTGAQ